MQLMSISEEEIPEEKDQRFHERYFGEVQRFHKYIDNDDSGTRLVWNFQVIPQNVELSQASVLNVEMEGWRFEGSLHDGDQVCLPCVPLGVGAIHVSKLENLTDHTQVIARRNRFSDNPGLVTILGLIVSVIAATIIFSDILFKT